MDVTFEPVEHRYFVDGVEKPSVSTILSLFADYSRVPRATLEAKRLLGRAVHKAIELYEAGTLDPESIDPLWEPYFEGWIRLKGDMPFKVFAAEEIVYSKRFGYCGRLDLNAELEGARWQIDVKCVDAMSPATALQTAGYAEAWNEMHPDMKITKRAGVQLRPDGSYRLYAYNAPEHRTDLNIFLNAVAIRNWLANKGML